MWTIAANKASNWYRGVLEAAERIMAERHENEASLSRNRYASGKGGAQGIGRGHSTVAGKPLLTKSGRGWQTGGEDARPTSGHLPRLPAAQNAAAVLNVVFLRLGLVGTLSLRFCSDRKCSIVGVGSLLV